MPFAHRNGYTWSMNEINRLYNEYEVKELDVSEIANLHGRTTNAIVNKLQEEGIITKDWTMARGYNECNECNVDASSISSDNLLNIGYNITIDSRDERSIDEEYDAYNITEKISVIESIVKNIFFYVKQYVYP